MPAIRCVATVLATAALVGGLASPTLAADSVTVGAQVSAATPCLVASTTSLDFGSNLFSQDNTDES